MTRLRPQVLVAIEPMLLGDLLRRALSEDDVDVVVRRESSWHVGRWDVAVVPQRRRHLLRARYVVQVSEQRGRSLRGRQQWTTPDFPSMVALVRRLCAVPS